MDNLVLYENILLLSSGIEACIEKRLIASSLILIYSAIDTVGWLDSPVEYSTKTSFTNWVDTYLIKAKPLKCTSLELYAARCGLLHTFSPESRLSSERKTRRIYYTWGIASNQSLQNLIDLCNRSTEFVAVHVKDLYEGWRLGVFQFVKELEKNHERKLRVYGKATKFFSELDLETVSMISDRFDKGEDV